MRSELKNNLERVGKLHETTRAYKNLDKITLKSEKAQIAFELQRDYGLRLKEAIHINLNRQLKDNITLFVQGKGGKIIEKHLDRDLVQKIEKNAQNGIFELKKDIYTKELKEAIEKMPDVFAAEYKLDGERVQIHKQANEVVLFSRRLENITQYYPDIVENVKKSLSVN